MRAASFCMVVMGFKPVEGYSLKGGDGLWGEVIEGPLGFLVEEELPLAALADSHGPWL